MIVSFKHKELKKFFERGDARKIHPQHIKRLRHILGILNAATHLKDLNFPGSDLHKLSGNLEGHLSITVKKNWSVTFVFENGDVSILDYTDYH